MTLRVLTPPTRQLLSWALITMETTPANELGTATSGNVSFDLMILFLVIGRGENYVTVKHQFQNKINEINENKTNQQTSQNIPGMRSRLDHSPEDDLISKNLS